MYSTFSREEVRRKISIASSIRRILLAGSMRRSHGPSARGPFRMIE
jgi:hypothetical protein